MNTLLMCLLVTVAQPETEPVQTRQEAMLESMAQVATQRRIRAIKGHRIKVEWNTRETVTQQPPEQEADQ